MVTIHADETDTLILGRVGENDVTQVVWERIIAAWLTEYPNAAIGLINRPSRQNEGYPVANVQQAGCTVTWTVKSSDLAEEGRGQCQLVAVENETIKKSAFWNTRVLPSLQGSATPPDPMTEWWDALVAMKADAEAAAESAEGSATAAAGSATEAASDATSASTSATKAKTSEQNAAVSETQARIYAGTASDAATAAQQYAYTANNAKNTATQKASEAAASAAAAAASAEAAATARGEIRDQNEGLFVRYDEDAALTEESRAQFRKNVGIAYTSEETVSLLGEIASRLGSVTVYADVPGYWTASGALSTQNPSEVWHTRMVPVKGFSKIYGRTFMDDFGYAVAYFDQNYQLLSELSVVGTGNMRFGNNGETEPLTIPDAACYASISGWGESTDYSFVFWGEPESAPGRMEMRGVSYADFGAKLDGVTDDTEAVIACHDYANAHGCPVFQHSGTVYMKTAQHRVNGVRHNVNIKTDVDWTGTTFLIKPPIQDERIVFAVCPDEEKEDVDLSPAQIDQLHAKKLNIDFLKDYPNELVTFMIERDYPDLVIGMRDGWEESAYPDPSYYSETAAIDRNGALMDGPLFLDISGCMPRDLSVSDHTQNVIGHMKMRRRSLLDAPITIKGGTFKLDHNGRFANPYYLYITRSNVTVQGLRCDAGDRYECDDMRYRGELIRADYAYNLCFRDCVMENFGNFLPASEQTLTNVSYVLVCTHCSNVLIDHCQFLRGWGPVQTSWCKRLTVRDSVMGRVDNHYGCRDFLIQGCTMVTSHSNINVGYGDGYLTVRDTKFIKTRDYDTIFNSRLIYCREDYCSIFQGNITLENIQIETFYETTLLYAALESSYAFKHENSNVMLPVKLPKVRMKNIYFQHLSDQPVKLTLLEYGARAEASALSYGNVEPDNVIIDGVWSDQPARILPMLENVHLTGNEPWVIKVKNFDCRIDVAEDDTIAPSETLAFDLPLVYLLKDPEMYFENRLNEANQADGTDWEAETGAAVAAALAQQHIYGVSVLGTGLTFIPGTQE